MASLPPKRDRTFLLCRIGHFHFSATSYHRTSYDRTSYHRTLRFLLRGGKLGGGAQVAPYNFGRIVYETDLWRCQSRTSGALVAAGGASAGCERHDSRDRSGF